jgi:hypothetical protein
VVVVVKGAELHDEIGKRCTVRFTSTVSMHLLREMDAVAEQR